MANKRHKPEEEEIVTKCLTSSPMGLIEAFA